MNESWEKIVEPRNLFINDMNDGGCRLITSLPKSGEVKIKGTYDPAALNDIPIMCRIETTYVERRWLLSPRGSASIIGGKAVFDGRVDKPRATVAEDGSPILELDFTPVSQAPAH